MLLASAVASSPFSSIAARDSGGQHEEVDVGIGLLEAFSLSGSSEPVHLQADRLEFDYKDRVLVYRGNVEVRQGDIALIAEEVRVVLHQSSKAEIREVRARGNVRLTQGERWATANEAIFDQMTRTAVLRGEAVLHDGRNQVQGERVTIFLDQKRSVVEGGSNRVQAVFYPEP